MSYTNDTVKHPATFLRVWWRRLQYAALIAFIAIMFGYAHSDCPQATSMLETVQHLEIMPSDARGKLEYCAYEVQTYRGRKLYPDSVRDLCGPTRAAVTALVEAYRDEGVHKQQGCWVHFSLWGMTRHSNTLTR